MLKILGTESSHNQSRQTILHQRDLIQLIDRCPQILKEDKLYLRNKLKNFFDEREENRQQKEAMQDLVYIFVECKKPLSKMHLYENHFHWLQVKLRKFITAEKKKEKDEKIKEFILQSPNRNLISNQKPRKAKQGASLAQNLFHSIANTNQNQPKNIQTPTNALRVERILSSEAKTLKSGTKPKNHQTSREKRDYQKWTKFKTSGEVCSPKSLSTRSQEKIIQGLNLSDKSKLKTRRGNNGGKSFDSSSFQKRSSQKMIRKGENSQNQQGQSVSFSNDISHHAGSLIEKQVPDDYEWCQQVQSNARDRWSKNPVDNIRNLSGGKGKKLTSQNLQLSEIPKHKHSRQPSLDEKYQYLTAFDENVDPSWGRQTDEDLFTPKQLLQECQLFLKTGNFLPQSDGNQSATQYQFIRSCQLQGRHHRNQLNSQLLISSKQRQSFQKETQIRSINALSSEFLSEQPQIGIKQFLRELFGSSDEPSYLIRVDSHKISQALKKLQPSLFLLAQDLIKWHGQEDCLCLNFCHIFAQLQGELRVEFQLSNIFQLLDVGQKGAVDEEDYSNFLRNFQIPEIDEQVFSQLCERIQRLKSRLVQVFGSASIGPGCLELLELRGDQALISLAEILQNFQFQIYT